MCGFTLGSNLSSEDTVDMTKPFVVTICAVYVKVSVARKADALIRSKASVIWENAAVLSIAVIFYC